MRFERGDTSARLAFCAMVSGLALAAGAGVSKAAAAPDQPKSTGVAEVVVTAQRRSQNIQDVPLSV